MPSELRSVQKILKPRRLGTAPIYRILKKAEVHIYLAGPISFAEDLQDYRRQLTEGLAKISPKFKIHDPWEREQVAVHETKSELEMAGIEEKKAAAEDIITKDLEDIASCDMVLAYMFRIGVGTSMEIFWCSRILGKPVIAVYQPAEEGAGPVPLWLLGHANLVFQSKRGLYSWVRKALEEIDESEQEKPQPQS